MLEDDEPELDELAREQFEDALVDGDVPFQRGTAQAALRHRNFRIVYFGTFASNIGTWMQNVVLGAYALKLTGSAALRRPPLLRPARPAAVPLDARRAARRRRRPPPLPRRCPARAARASRSCSPAIALSTHPSHALIVGVGVRGRHRERARRAGPERDPADARAPRRPARARSSLASVQMNLSRVIGPIDRRLHLLRARRRRRCSRSTR